MKEEAVTQLCRDIVSFRKKAGLPDRDVTKMQLVNWKLLKDVDGSMYASNAFVLLTSDYFPFSRTQCAVFKGTERGDFLDKREYVGPIYHQIEEAVSFVLRNIRLEAKVEGLLRRESYELPIEAIREMIINAHCHRLWKAFHKRCYAKLIVMQSQLRIPHKIKEFRTFCFA